MSTYKNLNNYKSTGQKFQNYPNKNIQKIPKTAENQGFWLYLKKVLDKFAENSTFHGVDRILKSNENKYKRFLWLFFFITSMAIFSYSSYELIEIQSETPFTTFVASTYYPIYKIPFPVVTICNQNRLNWQRYGAAKVKFLKPLHHSQEYEDIFIAAVNAYDTLTFGEFNKFENLTKFPMNLLQDLNYINFTLVVEFMSWKCYELFSECMWFNQHFNCCDIFVKRNSQLGSCLAFNAVESEEGRMKKLLDPYWPWHASGSGVENGLKVKVNIREFQHSPFSNNPKGLVFMLTEPYVWFSDHVFIPTHTRSLISFSAQLFFYDNYTRYYSSDKRECVFEDELNSLFYKSLYGQPYMFENCQSECQQEYLVKYCNCTVDLFYPPGQYKPCKLSDLPCLYKNKDILQYFEQVGDSEYVTPPSTEVMKCPCYFNCKSLSYATNINAAYMTNIEPDLNNSYIDISFYFFKSSVMVYQTTVSYTWTDLMVAFGGLAVLCIGCSILSVVELLYLIFVDIPKRIFHYFKILKDSNVLRKSRVIKRDLVRDILDK